MFKKDADENPSAHSGAAQNVPGSRSPAARKGGGGAIIGPSITIRGDVSGDEDLMIQGRIEGKVELAKHNVTIGPNGRVKADVQARIVVVEGEVDGDLRGQEQIILRQTAKVVGSISAPRVSLEDGAVFRGGIEMETSGKPKQIDEPKAAVSAEKKGPGLDAPSKAAGVAADQGKMASA